jgi:2-oxoglutarate dehydrogenase E1 component
VERFLSLCAQDNMTVAVPTTPANYFHLLRWQALSGRRKPLVVFTPKSMLRLKAATSPVAEFTAGAFQPVSADPAALDPAAVTRILLCSGKLRYDLAAHRVASGDTSVAIMALERLYPLPTDELRAGLAAYPATREVVWVQEEPVNMGAWPWIGLRLPGPLGRPLTVVSRPASSAPAAGSANMHRAEQQALIEAAFAPVASARA